MGKHTAAEDATVHPLVADALARRTGAPAAAHAEDATPRSGSTGWPEPPPSGGGAVGWPGELDEVRPSDGAAERAVPEPRRGWRRLFGASPAA
ncbi:hypothetical protein [Blastococcus sp. SYSU D01042]